LKGATAPLCGSIQRRSRCLGKRANRTTSDVAFARDDRFDSLGPCLVQPGKFVEGARRRATTTSQRLVKLGGQGQEREMMSDAREVDAHPPSDLRVGIAGVSTRAHEPGEIERRESMTLLVLGDLVIDVMGLGADDDRHCVEIRMHRRSQPLGTENDTVAVVAGRAAHDDRLKDAAQRNVSGEFGDLLVGEFGPRVVRVLVEAVDRNDEGKAGTERVVRAAVAAALTSSSATSALNLASGSALASSTRSSC
jgi:hypothetical protein